MERATLERIGERIRSRRAKAPWVTDDGELVIGMSQSELARKLHITQPSVSQWERGHTLPTERLQYRICDVLRCARSELFSEVVEERAA